MKKIMIRGGIGSLIGLFFSITIALFISISMNKLSMSPPKANTTDLQSFIIMYASSLILGFGFGSSSLVFETDKSLFTQTFTHFVLISIFYWPIAIINQWIILSFFNILFYIFVFILIYVCIWLSFKTYWKKKVEMLNAELNNREV